MQYREEHTQCRYFAQGHSVLFRHMRFAAGYLLPDFSRGRCVLLYLASGSMEVTSGSYATETVSGPHLMLLPKNALVYGRSVMDLEICTCELPSRFHLCSSYGLTDLQQEIRDLNRGKLPPPVGFSENSRKQAY